jgi:ketosteroid isomerase-like protein
MRLNSSTAVLFLAIALASCTHPQRVDGPEAPALSGDNANLPPQLARVLREYEDAWQNKDAEALARLFAEDGFVLSSGSPPVRGRTNIEKHYAGAGGPLALRAMAWAKQDDIGYIIGEYATDATFTNSGKFTLTLVRGDGDRWLIFSDMDNGHTRPRPSQATPASP